MFKKRKLKLISLSALAIIFAVVILASGMVAGQSEISVNIEEKLNALSDEEKIVLQKLFILAQEIAEMEREESRLGPEMEKITSEIHELEKLIAAEETVYEKRQEALKQVLRSYQRMGPSSYLEIILESNSLAVFLRRLNTLRDLTRNTGELLGALQESSEKLTAEKIKVAEKLVLLAETQELLKESLLKTMQLKEEQQEYLASLAEEREYYHNQLANMQRAWSELTQYFPEVTKKSSRIIEDANLPPDALKTVITLSGIKASISDNTLNNIIMGHGLSEMVFRFFPGTVEIAVPDKNLVLAGTFILEGETLKFLAQEGSFYGMALKTENLKELFGEAELLLNLKTLVGDNSLRSIEILAGRMELLISF
jgi:peptidoglycan hydrolase CwlO-like protein